MNRSVVMIATGVGLASLLVACNDASSSLGEVHPPRSTAPTTVDRTTPGTTEAAPAPKLLKFTPQGFVDPRANGTTAIKVLVPEGWNANGSVQWLPEWERLAFLQTHLDDPVSGVSIDWLPIQDFMYFKPPSGFSVPIGGNYQGKAYVAPITDPVNFVNQFWVPNFLSELAGMKPVSVVEQPAIAQAFVN
ncbi:MAG: hypothetical protein WCK21_12135, partial [Actinomycetota bacterium]